MSVHHRARRLHLHLMGKRLASGRVPHATSRDAAGGFRQEPDAWWHSLVAAVSQSCDSRFKVSGHRTCGADRDAHCTWGRLRTARTCMDLAGWSG